ncbi:hypothetical protein EBAPG3_014045 [Nitrosospira lacus]|uniref:DUF676 domain-containing protein n=1 Tax=Nitrosospira lacus TaxID=1288494 RepID=A0A1W6SSN8_9PROT|nr:ATP/GTP-binding protein [Nitrosospira lacus]ARO88799.1 hypothetical protein EBAPG3_014045 [Nitrosospira lacus]
MSLTNRFPDRDSTKATVNVVFVHGLGGDELDTWTDKSSTDGFWPKWLGADFPNLGIWTLGYAANATKWTQDTMLLADQGISILNELYVNDLDKKPLIFIAHSLGGIIVKEFLHQAVSLGDTTFKPIADNTRGIVFIATPHLGSIGGNLLAMADHFLRTNETAKALALHNDQLRDIHQFFKGYLKDHPKVDCLSFSETCPVAAEIFGLKFRGGIIVDPTSADPQTNRTCVPIQADHISICKPRSREDSLYKSIKKFIQEYLGKPGEAFKVPIIRGPDFIDSNDVLKQLKSNFNSLGSQGCLIVLTGADGIGKTRIALEYSHGHKKDYRGGTCWINAESKETIAGDFFEMAKKLKLCNPTDRNEPQVTGMLVTWLEEQVDPWLLIFDHAEDYMSLGGYLPRGPHHVLITSHNDIWEPPAIVQPVLKLRRPDSIKLLTTLSPLERRTC